MPLPVSKPQKSTKPAKKQLNGFSVADLFSSSTKDDQKTVQLAPLKQQIKSPLPTPTPKSSPMHNKSSSTSSTIKQPQKRKTMVPTKLGQAVTSSDSEEETPQPISITTQISPANPVKKAKPSSTIPISLKKLKPQCIKESDDKNEINSLFFQMRDQKRDRREQIKENTKQFNRNKNSRANTALTSQDGNKYDPNNPPTNQVAPQDDMGFTNSGQNQRKRTEDGFLIYSCEELKFEEGGGTELCPFDCDCCFA